jgi:murein tripeptide amidase MpaA
MELLTITGKDDKILQERELLMDGLFPYHNSDIQPRPLIVKKSTVFLTSRVHPGETPASFVLNGILSFILNEKSEQAKILRERFVFKVIPILNPDGVYRGYYRHDTKNQNLNRYYLEPTKED